MSFAPFDVVLVPFPYVDRLAEKRREEIRRHLDLITTGALQDRLDARYAAEIRQQRMTGNRTNRAWKFFEPATSMTKELADRPSDVEMARWLDYDKLYVKNLAMNTAGLANRDLIAHAILTEAGYPCMRARVLFGPLRYSRYRVTVFLLTEAGVRQVSLDLDFLDGTLSYQRRTSFRYDAVSSARVTEVEIWLDSGRRSVIALNDAHDGRQSPQEVNSPIVSQALRLSLTDGHVVDVVIEDAVGGFLDQLREDKESLLELALDSSGVKNALRVLDSVAAEGRGWIQEERRRRNRRILDFSKALPSTQSADGEQTSMSGQALTAPSGLPTADAATAISDEKAAASAKLGLGTQRSPWLEPLPELITLGELPAADAERPDVPPIPYGLTDLPPRQARAPLALDFQHPGHVAVAGAPQTGRSSLLRTLAGSVATLASPADVHIYGIDCDAGALRPVADLPHCGAVVTRTQGDRMERLLSKLQNEIARRQQLLATQGFADLAEQRAATSGADRLPWMLLLLDSWEGYVTAFENLDHGRLIETLLRILREGSAVGLRAVFTTSRTALIGQTGTIFAQRMILRMTNRSDASLADIGERALPAHQPAGRVMFAAKPNPLEAQIALLDANPVGVAQVAALCRIGEQARQRIGRPPAQQRPLRVDELPTRITVAQTYRLDPDFTPPSPMWALAGVGGDQLSPQGIDVRDEGPGIVVAGPPHSGRSTTLLTMARSLIVAQTPILVITPRHSPLRILEGTPGVAAVLDPTSTSSSSGPN